MKGVRMCSPPGPPSSGMFKFLIRDRKLTAAFDDAFVECGVRIISTPGPSGPYVVWALGAVLLGSGVGSGR